MQMTQVSGCFSSILYQHWAKVVSPKLVESELLSMNLLALSLKSTGHSRALGFCCGAISHLDSIGSLTRLSQMPTVLFLRSLHVR